MFKNIIANYIGKVWGIVSVFFFTPFYIKILGIEAYGVINFYSVILTIMYFADAGLSLTLNREMSRSGDKKYLGDMLFTIERLYVAICLFIFVFVTLFSKIIADNLMNSQTIPSGDLRIYIIIMGLSVAFQLFTTLENSGLWGLEKQVLSNGIQVLSGIFRSAIILVPLSFYPSLMTFFIWQAFVNVTFFLLARYNLWRFVKSNSIPKFDINILKSVGRFAGGMMFMAIISSISSQIDKLLIVKMLSLKQFGYYSLAGVLSQVPVIIISPIILAILPKMVKQSEMKNNDKLKKLFHVYSFILSSIATSVALVIFLFTKDFILIWTHDINIANTIEYVTKILVLGGVFLSFQYMPYHLAIANGHTKTTINFNILSLILIIPILFFLVSNYGLIGATFSWLVSNIVACFYLGYILINKFLLHEFNKWLLYDTIIPLLVTSFIGITSYYITNTLPKGYYVIIYSVVIGLISLFVNYFVYIKVLRQYSLKDFFNYS